MIASYLCTIGCDPELFLEKEGKIIGAEKAVPKEGLAGSYTIPSVVLDGVQVELNPLAAICRAQVGGSIASAFRLLKDHIEKTGAVASFKPVVEVEEEEFKSLSPSAQQLGCLPSNNAYDQAAKISVVDGFRQRSAGGHIHLGFPHDGLFSMCQSGHRDRPATNNLNPQDRLELIPILDILVGNTCVLLDRDPSAAERRKNYGRAGEYRLPKHGLEYRTLSNFWLRSYPLMSFVTGLARMAFNAKWTDKNAGNTVYDNSRHLSGVMTSQNLAIYQQVPATQNLCAELLRKVDIKSVVEAINTNDLDLARTNFNAVKPWIMEHVHPSDGDYGWPLHQDNLEVFEFFLETGGIEGWFFEDPMVHWTSNPVGDGGWEKFLKNKVKWAMQHQAWMQEKGLL